MKIYNLLALVLFFSGTVLGQKVHHKLSMPAPETHYFHVETTLTDFDEEELVIVMPVWTPGSYLVREFPKNVNLVRAKDEKGNKLEVKKVSKNKWQIDKGNANKVTVNYEVYAFELTVRTSFLDKTHGYINGTSIFTFPENHIDLGGNLTIIPHSSFKTITAPLEESKEGFSTDNNAKTFVFDSFDHLADSPIEIGNQETFTFEAAGTKHNVAIYGPGNYDIERLKVDMAKIVESTTAVFGQNPNKEYWFIIHNTDSRGGGLEHMNSTTLHVNRWTYSGDAYLSFLSLVAHEYFHIWNVKRLRPANLVEYDYSNENYTDLLWVMEGFTSYYDELILRRAGFYSEEDYLNVFKNTINYVEGTPGNRVQPVAHSSYDAWIKSYRPNENSRNTGISYYSKGAMLAHAIDAMIIKKFKGKKSLDEFMQLLYKKFYEEENSGMTPAQFKATLEDFLGDNLDDFFKNYVYGIETIPYASYFKDLGLTIEKVRETRTSLGISMSSKEGKVIIDRVQSNSEGEKAGLSPNDEVIAFNGFRVDVRSLHDFLGELPVGTEFNLIIARGDQLMSIDAKMGTIDAPRYEFSYEEHKLGTYWLRKK
ncbi:M61 family metallopeptidase [Brumimicrobium aurantiacum]|uniref:M61 family peptidase n=1 Tax=Brumimicrobium aurantiacum TaxID=1737063 RepID=A0A3E1F0B2_9FLAO|nr:PDZ domain-containing protein [Brumimicrobium aurantiacum]RFC55262.1 M61 family peptidase [Brumimicrobium aurantiacum]